MEPSDINAACRAYLSRHGVPGLAVAVVKDGKPWHVAGLGHREMGTKTPISPRTLFHLASVTKTVTATAAMQLVEAGKLDLDRPLVEFIPKFGMDDDDRVEALTARHLMTHTSGLPDADDLEFHKPQTDAKALKRYAMLIRHKELYSYPGEAFNYTDVNFDLLGHVISVVSGMVFEDYVTENVLRPLGMKDSTLMYSSAPKSQLATPHIRDGYELTPWEIFPYNRRHSPSSTLCSNALDMSKWITANLNHGHLGGKRILTRKLHEQLWRETSRTHGHFWMGVGMGFFIGHHHHWKFVGHEGSDRGFRASLCIVPSARMGIAVLVNMDGDHLKPLMSELMEMVLTAD